MWYSFGIPDTFFCHGTSKQRLFPRFHQAWLVILYTFQVGLVLYKLGCCWMLGSLRPLLTLRGWSAFVHARPLLGRSTWQLGTWSTWPPIRPRPNAEPSVEHSHLSVRNQTSRICWRTSLLNLNFLSADSLCPIMPGHIKKTTGLFC